MKKLVSLLMVLALALLSVSAFADAGDVTGEWYLKTFISDGNEIDAASIGYTMTLTLNADGSASSAFGGMEPSTGTWTLDGDQLTVTIDDSPASGTVTADSITLSSDTQSMVLTREPVAAITLAESNPDAKLEDFAGNWTCKYVQMQGMVVDIESVPAEQLGTTGIPGMTIEGNKVTLTGMDSLAGSDPIEMEFADGALSIDLGAALKEALGGSSIEGLEGLEMKINLHMLQDGMACMDILAMGVEIGFVFVPAAAAEAPAA